MENCVNQKIAGAKTVMNVDSTDLQIETRCPVVGIVASAGGLSAFNHFFEAMPAICGAAFVLVPHLDATHKSLMVELLSRQTSMPVIEATDSVLVEADHVYIIPPNHLLTIENGRLRLSDLQVPAESQTAMDIFLRSLAADQGERAIGIVLSGTGSHGTLGIREIKRCGGIAVAQSPESAEFDQMPLSAIETGLVDFVLPPEQMPEALLKYFQQPYVKLPHGLNTSTGDPIEELIAILNLVRERTKYDFSSYRKNMLMRRVERRMGLLQLVDRREYLQVLREQPQELQSLFRDFLIGVTQFFREPDAYAVLEKEVIPALVSKQTADTPIRVWVPSCATGEEAYSIAILLFEALIAAGKPLNFQVFASDINDNSIDFARRGIYSASIAIDVSAERLKQFFEPENELHYRVTKKLRDFLVFSNQNLISDAPFSKMDLVSCRNVLIYLEPEVQQKLVSLFHFALNQHGYLILGSAETIGREFSLFETVSKKWRIYRRMGPAKTPATNLPEMGIHSQRTFSNAAILPPKKSYKELTDSLLSEYEPATALINRQHEILNVTGPLVNFLEFPSGEITKDLLALARPGLRTRLRSACHKALTERSVVRDVRARVKRDGSYFSCSITLRPVLDPNYSEDLLLVIFQDRRPDQLSIENDWKTTVERETLDAASNAPLVDLLEFELKKTREELQGTSEQLRGGIEELQSSNEELESSKEELQSLNEELNTVNCQLVEKIAELDLSNSEINDLMTSTEIATLYIDKELRIKRFTAPALKLLRLSPSDEGKHLRELNAPLLDDDLFEECQQVLIDYQHVETEVNSVDGKSYLRRTLPFQASHNQSKGVVVTFIDLTERRRLESQQRELDSKFRKVFDNVATGVAITTWDRLFEHCNPAYCELLGYSQEELHCTDFISLIHPEDQECYTEKIEELKSGRVSSFEIENRYFRKDGQLVWVRKFLSVLPDETGKPAYLVKLITNQTQQRKAAAELQRSEAMTRAILASLPSHIAVIDDEGTIIATNPAWDGFGLRNGGSPERTGVGTNYFKVCQPVADNKKDCEVSEQVVDGLRRVLAGTSELFNIEYPCHSPTEKLWFSLQATPLKYDVGGAVVSHQNITDRKLAEYKVYESGERLRTILDTASDAIITIDIHGTITGVNQATTSLFGYTSVDLVGKNVKILLHSPFLREGESFLQRFVPTGKDPVIGHGSEVICRRKDGGTFHGDLAVSRVDHLDLFTLILRDITNRIEMQKHILEIAADEQRRIGLELHDGTQQELTGLSLYATALQETIQNASQIIQDKATVWQFEVENYNQLKDTAALLSKRLVETNQHVRDISHGIMPVQIEANSLPSSLIELAKSIASNNGTSCVFECEGEIKVPNNATSTHLYRIAQEAVNNALRHSHASQIKIHLSQQDDRICIEVIDNGIGFNDETTPRSRLTNKGMGLKTMEYRASLIGGRVQIQPVPEGGTCVKCEILGGVACDS
jgi:two-component system CheB/CheR fusion protein